VAVLFSQLSITGASLEPGNVSLLSSTSPIPVNVSQLQADSAFLGSANVATGTYTSLSLTFSNPQLTIYNASDSAITSSCTIGTVCQLTPTTTPLTLTFSSAPFPVTLAANSPLAFKLDIHLNAIIQSDLSVNLAATNGVTLSQLPSPPAGGPISGLGTLIGTAQSVGTNQFTLQTADGRTFTIYVNGSTTYSLPDSLCLPGSTICPALSTCAINTFSCLIVGEVDRVTVSLQLDGTLLATEVAYLQPATQQAVEGTIVGLSTSGGNTIIDLILQEQPLSSMSSTLPSGAHASVTVPSSGVTYLVDWDIFTPPSGVALSFGSASDLQVGQEVLVFVQGSVTTSSGSGTSGATGSSPVGPATLSFTTNFISLEPTQITGQISNINAGALNFTISTFPNFFIPTEEPWGTPTLLSTYITVDTTAQTTYQGLSQDNLSGLAVNDLVSVEAWLFPYSGPTALVMCVTPCPVATTMVAKAVRGRPNQLF
jgi:hypothetical protein